MTPTYDARGNLTSAGSATYGYSSENLLTSASGGITLAYDSMLRLYQTAGGSAGTTRFAYDGADLVAEHNGSNAMLRRYVHGPGSDEPLVWYEGSGTSDRRFLHSDERGSVIATSNSSGTTLATNAYDEYGIPKSTNSGRFQYTGQTWLPELGMYHYKARVYSPTLGRFLQTDPIGYGDGMNLYAYVGNDPVNFRDPMGLCSITVWGRFLHNEDWTEVILLDIWAERSGCDGAAGGGGFGSGDGGAAGGTQSPTVECAADPSCVAKVDDIVVTGYRRRRFNDRRWNFLPWPKEPVWFVYPNFSVASGVTVVEKDRCGQARHRTTAPRPGYIALIHAHSAGSPGWPGSADISNATRMLVYGMFSEENGNTGVWRMGPGSDSVVRVAGDRPSSLDLSRPGSNIRDPAPTEARCAE